MRAPWCGKLRSWQPLSPGGPARRTLLLVGMMGSGKSLAARSVAGRLGWDWVDTDEAVEKEANTTVAEMFSSLGEAAFRDAESKAIYNWGESRGQLWSASAEARSCLRPENRNAIQALGIVVWLRARATTLAARVGRGDGRPLLSAGEPAEASETEARGRDESAGAVLARLASERAPFYTEVADVIVDVDDLSEEEVADRVLAVVEAARR